MTDFPRGVLRDGSALLVCETMDTKPQALEQIIAERVAAVVAERLESMAAPAVETEPAEPYGWEVLFWTVPAEVRIQPAEVMAGLRKRKSWLYARTGDSCPASKRIPHRHGVDGELWFVVGEVRDWFIEQERIKVPGTHARRDFESKHGKLKVG